MRQGTKIEFSGGELTLHPLTLSQLQELEGDIMEMRTFNARTALSKDLSNRMAKIVAAAAKRAQPDITPEIVLGMIDLQDVVGGVVATAITALMGQSGLEPRKANGTPPGELMAPETDTSSTGADSTLVSLPASDGDLGKSTS